MLRCTISWHNEIVALKIYTYATNIKLQAKYIYFSPETQTKKKYIKLQRIRELTELDYLRIFFT
jgi:hypothetical protein